MTSKLNRERGESPQPSRGEVEWKDRLMSLPILCLDFDGVIHSYESPWVDAVTIPDRPVDGAFDFIREAQRHFTVAIYSSRSHVPGGIAAMQAWLLYHATKGNDRRLMWLADIQWPTHKPTAFLTLDDRVIRFDGVWPEVEQLRKFKPWNKRETKP